MKHQKLINKSKGLSDAELIKKYEQRSSTGRFTKVIKAMINTPAPGIEKRQKKK